MSKPIKVFDILRDSEHELTGRWAIRHTPWNQHELYIEVKVGWFSNKTKWINSDYIAEVHDCHD